MHREWNARLKDIFNSKLKESGLKMTHVSEQLDIEYTTLSKWKNGHLNFGEDNLKKITAYIEKI